MKDELACFLAGENFTVEAPFVNGIGMDCGSSIYDISTSGSCGSSTPVFVSSCGFPVLNDYSKHTNSTDKRRKHLTTSLSEHRKHCKAKHGKCPYEKEEHKKQKQDDLSSTAQHIKHKLSKHSHKAQKYIENGDIKKAKKHLSKAQYYMSLINK